MRTLRVKTIESPSSMQIRPGRRFFTGKEAKNLIPAEDTDYLEPEPLLSGSGESKFYRVVTEAPWEDNEN